MSQADQLRRAMNAAQSLIDSPITRDAEKRWVKALRRRLTREWRTVRRAEGHSEWTPDQVAFKMRQPKLRQ